MRDIGIIFLVGLLCISILTGCGEVSEIENTQSTNTVKSAETQENPSVHEMTDAGEDKEEKEAGDTAGTRDNTPVVLTPAASKETVYENDVAHIDASNVSEGYIMASYTGSNQKVKLQITCDGGTTYTYDIVSSDYVAYPLSSGSGSYLVEIYENLSGDRYSTCLSKTIDVKIKNEFGAFLYPNRYCEFSSDSQCVAKSAELVALASSDLDAVSLIYNYIIENITYDKEHANNLEKGYVADPDTTLSSGTGICLDYASLMAAMLRSQNIPTHLEVGYAGEAYHAWISVYIKDVGWINGMIEFDGENWQLMDPTFASNSSENALREFIGNGDNYTVKYIY